jgi:hypothetical protein
MMKTRKFHPAPVAHAPLYDAAELDRIYQEAQAEGEHYVVALCDVVRDPRSPLSAAKCWEMLRAFDRGDDESAD